MTERFFTLEEANAALEELGDVLPRIREARQTILASAEQVRGAAGSNGGGEEGAAYWEAIRTLRRELEGLSARGIILRDAETGLVDFPSRRENRTVFLCWRLGEDSVSHWHEVDAGMAGRERL